MPNTIGKIISVYVVLDFVGNMIGTTQSTLFSSYKIAVFRDVKALAVNKPKEGILTA